MVYYKVEMELLPVTFLCTIFLSCAKDTDRESDIKDEITSSRI